MGRKTPGIVLEPASQINLGIGIPVLSRCDEMIHKPFKKILRIITACAYHRTHQYANQMGAKRILSSHESVMVVETVCQLRNPIAVLTLSFGRLDCQIAIARVIKTSMRMENVIGTTKAVCGFDVRMVRHSHHEAFRMRMRWCLVSTNTAIEILSDVSQAIKPMGRHCQRIANEKSP